MVTDEESLRPRTLAEILADFPNAAPGKNCWESSPKSSAYNCFAWAAGDDTREWDPRSQYHPYVYWPRRAPAALTLAAFEEAFRIAEGYSRCESHGHEVGIEKVAIFADEQGCPRHMARQLPSGIWASKLGHDEDIEHSDLAALENGDYGRVVLILARPAR